MINLDDYKSYLLQNQDFLDVLKESKSLIYERLEDVFLVMEFIGKRFEKYDKVEEEFEVIFEVGFAYLHEQLEVAKNIYKLYFKVDLAGLKKYESLINYHLYLCDLEEALKEKSLYTDQAKAIIFSIFEEIELILSKKKNFESEIFDRFNMMIEEIASVGTLSTQEIFSLVKEEIDLSE